MLLKIFECGDTGIRHALPTPTFELFKESRFWGLHRCRYVTTTYRLEFERGELELAQSLEAMTEVTFDLVANAWTLVGHTDCQGRAVRTRLVHDAREFGEEWKMADSRASAVILGTMIDRLNGDHK